MSTKKFICALTFLAVSATSAAAQSFDTFNYRGNSRSIAVVRTAGDFYVRAGDTYELYGGELEYRRLGARFSMGDAVNPVYGPQSALVAGLDHAFDVGFGIPVVLTVGADYAQAGTPASEGVREMALPLRLENNATIDFGSVWFHPTIMVGVRAFRTTTDGLDDSGVRPDMGTGLEMGIGGWSARARLRHNLRAPQRAELALRRTF